jgi:hypothetical protein
MRIIFDGGVSNTRSTGWQGRIHSPTRTPPSRETPGPGGTSPVLVASGSPCY